MVATVSILSTLLLSTAVNSFSYVPSFTSRSGLSSVTKVSTSLYSTSTQAGHFDYALIFDCDGVIIETEELHRLAYNAAFKAADLHIDGELVE